MSAISGLSPLTLGVGIVVVIVSYAVIIAAARQSIRELIWTVIPAVLLLVLLYFSARAVGWFGF